MKIAITATGNNLTSDMDSRFGRAKGFIIYDDSNGDFIYKDNEQNLNAVQGAGIQAAKTIIDSGCFSLITGNVGPKAFAALNSASIKIYTGASGSVLESIEAFKKGELTLTFDATVEGHH